MAADINFYGLLYEFHRTSTNGADILITIEKKWYEGEVKQRALGRAPVIKRENKDHIFGTSCELYAECLVDGEYADMYTSDPYEFRVSVYKDETLLWQGFVSPELYSEPDAAPPYDVQITATDGLGELKNSLYEERGAVSILSHIMGLIGQYPIYVISGLRYVDSTGAISQDHDILNVHIDLDHEKGNSKYDVLQNLLTSLNANITQLNGRYVIFRETDFINKATDEGVEAFDVNGEKVYISIASFGSMTSHQWWPIGQLSTVVEPAKNSLVLQAPNHYKDNVLDFSQWSILNSAEYDATEDAYILPDEGSYITQALEFDNEVGYRLGLRIRARNVGDSEEDQNIGLMIKVNARTYAAPEGRDFWLVKSEVSTGNARTDYLWRGQEDHFEEALNMPSDADTASDAQNVDIVIPLYDHSQNGLSYIFASSLSIKIFNPDGIHDIYVYDVSLVKYEQSEGYEAKVVINNAAREAESDIDLSMSSASFAPAAGNMFMTGLPMQTDGLLIEQWQIPGSAAQEYLSSMSYDYARAVALPKMKYSGVLNVPDTATILPILFLRDGTYYFPKTYTYDLYNDEIQVELISISAADVSLSSVVISQYAESSGNMGGVTTGGGGGGSVVSLPRDKVMSDTSDNAVENRVIKAYVDSEVKELADLLNSMWRIEDDKIVTDMDVLVKANLIVEKDTSSGGEGEDTPAEGTVTGIEVNGTPYEPNTQGVIDLSAAFNAIDVSDQLKDYYTKTQTDSAISTAIAAIDLSIYAKSKDVYTKTQIDEIEEGIGTALETKAKQSDLVTLQGEVDNIEAVLGLSETAEGYINTWAEVVAFLDGYKNADDLATILSGINADIAKNAEDIATLDNDKADKTTVTALAERVSANEGAIDDNAGNIKKNFDAIGALDKRVTAEEAVTTTYASWWADLKKWVTVEDGNVKISTNLIVTGDTSSGGSGEDTPASGTVTGIKVSATQTLTPNNAGVIDMVSTLASIDVSDQLKDYALKTDIPSLDGYATETWVNDQGYLTGITQSMIGTALGSANNGGKVLISTGGGLGWASMPTSLPASDVYAWAKKPSLALADVPNLSSKYLPLSGGTISGSGFAPLSINRTSASGLGILLKSADANKASLSWDSSLGTYIYNYASAKTMGIKEDGTPYYDSYTLIHSGNIGEQRVQRAKYLDTLNAAGSNWYDNKYVVYGQWGSDDILDWKVDNYEVRVDRAKKLQTARTIWGRSFDGTGDVSGQMFTPSGYEAINILDEYVIVGYGLAGKSKPTYIDGYNIYFRYGTNHARGLTLNSSGNVTIGGSDLASTNYRLYVEGGAFLTEPTNGRFYTRISSASIQFGNISSKYTGGYNTGVTHGTDGTATGYLIGAYKEGSTVQYIYIDGTSSSSTMVIKDGNVGIGTASPTYKLNVNGVTKVSALRTAYIGIDCDADGNTSGYGSEINRFGAHLYLQTREGNLYLSHSAGTTYIRGLASITGAVTMSNELFLGNNMGIYFKNSSGTNVLAMYVNPSNVLQVGYNNVDSVAFQKPVTMSSTLSVLGPLVITGTDSSTAILSFSRQSASYIAAPVGGSVYINVSGNISSNYSSLRVTSSHVSKGADLTVNLGESSNPWSTIYGVNGIFSGAVSIGNTLSVGGNITIQPTATSDVSLLFVTGNLNDGYYDYKIGKFTDKNSVGGFGMAIANNSAQWTKFLSLSTDGLYNVTSVNILTNLVVSGDTSSGSDIRFKDIIKNKTLKIEHIAKAPLFTFKWNDRADDAIHLGSSAQYWENVCPWLVTGEDFKSLNYATLGVAMGISLAKKAVNHEERIKVLEKENKALKEEIRRMQYGS